jgi:DNA modification methylase
MTTEQVRTKRPSRKQGDPTKSGQRKLVYLATTALTPAADNPRKHSRAQVRAIAKSIEAFGFTAPLLVDKNLTVIAGHGRLEAAKLLGLTSVPVIHLDHLSDAQALAYRMADNQLADRSTWDDAKVAAQLRELTELALEFDIEATGFEPPEIDLRILSLDEADMADRADEFELAAGPVVSVTGDLWHLGDHRLYCGDTRDAHALRSLMDGEKASVAFSDPPYNVPIDGHVSGKGSVKHREFAMASGEMSKAEFTEFLTNGLGALSEHTTHGALLYICMDWRHMSELLAAGEANACELVNLCIWAKSNAAMGSLYRSRHELVFVFKNGNEPHRNNVQLGRFGRNRSNVWNYPGANNFGRKSAKSGFGLHPTVKPILLVADAILDSTQRNQIVLDPFLGSGTTILAAERTGRRCFGIEIDPLYVDTAIERWQRMSGREARHANGEAFTALKEVRRAVP